MKSRILIFFLRFSVTSKMFYFLLKIKHANKLKNIIEECKSRKDLGIFEFENLSRSIENQLEPNEIHFYGFDKVLANFLQKPKLKKDITNEHGFIFSSFVSNYYKPTDIVLTFSDYREKLIKEKYHDKVNILKIGPYIHYADSIFSANEFEKVKKELGKTLLVFPFHSIDGVLSSFNTDTFIEQIDKYKIEKNFDNVVVCLYWKDIQIGRAEEYIQKGYKVTTAGHINDMYFLNRLRAIIELADFVISNELGTYIGYCLCLNKEIRLINQKSEFIIEKGKEDHINSKGFVEVEKHLSDYYLLQQKLMHVLASETIKSNDLDFVKDLFGLQYIKSQSELKNILS